jgi:hypothetical protein
MPPNYDVIVKRAAHAIEMMLTLFHSDDADPFWNIG